MTEKKNAFPILPLANWWALRNRFKQSIPSSVSPGFVAAVLNMKEKSAQGNILPHLVTMGIIDQDGKPLERANRWRDDQYYPEVCREILNEVYPKELLEALPGPSLDRNAVKRWFAINTGLGEVAVGRMAAFYELLITADPSDAQATSIKKVTTQKSTTKPKERAQTTTKPPKTSPGLVGQRDNQQSDNIPSQPTIHLDIQIHISPDATAEQIDSIFASMAKHLYKK
jgi:hypothetical protein